MLGEKIQYTIDNYSGLIPRIEFDSRCPKNIAGVYCLFDLNETLVYIGKSSNIRSRLHIHCFADHSRYMTEAQRQHAQKKRDDFHFFSFSIIDKEYINVVEPFLINKYKPKYNIEFNHGKK